MADDRQTDMDMTGDADTRDTTTDANTGDDEALRRDLPDQNETTDTDTTGM